MAVGSETRVPEPSPPSIYSPVTPRGGEEFIVSQLSSPLVPGRCSGATT